MGETAVRNGERAPEGAKEETPSHGQAKQVKLRDMRFPVPIHVHQHPPAEMALKEKGGRLGYTLNKRQGSETLCTDVLVLQPHQCAVQVKVWGGFWPSLGHLLPQGGSGCLRPGDGLGLLMELKG